MRKNGLKGGIRNWNTINGKCKSNERITKKNHLSAKNWWEKRTGATIYNIRIITEEEWLDKGITFISDLLNPPLPGRKLFEELVLDFDISPQDRRKYNFLMKNIPEDWFFFIWFLTEYDIWYNENKTPWY